jgi:hypothetical protein
MSKRLIIVLVKGFGTESSVWNDRVWDWKDNPSCDPIYVYKQVY